MNILATSKRNFKGKKQTVSVIGNNLSNSATTVFTLVTSWINSIKDCNDTVGDNFERINNIFDSTVDTNNTGANVNITFVVEDTTTDYSGATTTDNLMKSKYVTFNLDFESSSDVGTEFKRYFPNTYNTHIIRAALINLKS